MDINKVLSVVLEEWSKRQNIYDKTSFYKWIIDSLGGIVACLKDMNTDQPRHDNV